MCSSMLLVAQSTIVTASIVRGSAPRPITISLLLTRSWASAGAARATTTRTTVTARKKERIKPPLNAKLRIEGVAEPVAEQVHAKRRQCQRRARKGGQPPRDVEEVAALGQHRAPRGRGRLNTEAQERDGGFRHDELRELQAGHDDDRRRDPRAVEDAGEQVATELIGAQRVARRAWGPQALSEVARQRIDRRQPRRGGGGHDRGERDADAEPGLHARSLTRGSSQP